MHYLGAYQLSQPLTILPVRAERHGYLECLSMTLEMGPAATFVRVRRIDEDQRQVFVELRNGQTATLNGRDDPVDWDGGYRPPR